MPDSQWKPHLLKTLEHTHRDYNDEVQMLCTPFSSPGYHTSIKKADVVHRTRESLEYALAILDTGDERYLERSFEIIRKVISLQDRRPDSSTFGVWSWYLEEPLDRMESPDLNWADFCGKRLLLALVRHGDLFPQELRHLTTEAVKNSCEAIIKRNVGPEYTNIAVMGAFVTLIFGELLQEKRFIDYGLARLKRLHDYTMLTGTILEYNSPTYGVVTILELSGLSCYTRLTEARILANELLETVWEMAASHYHPGLKQWSGPNARSYHTFISPEVLSFLHMACGGKEHLIDESDFVYSLEWYGNGIRCPERLLHLFRETGIRELKAVLPATPQFASRYAYTYMTPDLTIGSFNHNIMWNQCRNLLAFVKTGDKDNAYIRLRGLHDGYDFCSAIFKGVQQKTSVLYGIQFALNGGDTHPNLDPAGGRINASDFRIRLELGYTGMYPTNWKRNGDKFTTALGERFVSVGLLYGAMDGFGPFRWETVRNGSVTGLDYVLYSGERRIIDFHVMEEALFMFSMEIAEAGGLTGATAAQSGERVEGSLDIPGGNLTLSLKKKPDTLKSLFHDNEE